MILGVIFGSILCILFEFNKAIKRENFSFKTFIKLNIIPALINISCGLVLIWAKDDVDIYFKITKFSSIVLGMSGQTIFKKIIGVFDKKTNTYLGINK